MEETKGRGGRRSSLNMGVSPVNSLASLEANETTPTVPVRTESSNPLNAPVNESKDSDVDGKKKRRSSTVGMLNMGISEETAADGDKPTNGSGGGRRSSTVLAQGGPKRRSSIVIGGLGDHNVSQDAVVMQAEQSVGLINQPEGKPRRRSSVAMNNLSSVNDDDEEVNYDGGDEADDTMTGPDDFDPADIPGRERSGAATGIMKRRASQWERALSRKKGVGMTAVFKAQTQAATLQVNILRGYRMNQNSMFQMNTPDIFIAVMFNNEHIYTSPIIRNTFTPSWKDTAKFTVPIPEGSALGDNKLEFFVYDADGGDGSDPTKAQTNKDASNKNDTTKDPSANLNKGGSFGAKLFSALGLGANKGMIRKLVGSALCTNAYIEFLGKTSSLQETMRMEVKQSQNNDAEEVECKGTLEIIGCYTEAVVEHELDNDHAEANELLNMAMGDDEEEDSDSDKSTEYSGEKTDSDEDDEDDFDTIEFSLLAAKNLAKADMMGLSDPYAKFTYDGRDLGVSKVIDNSLYPRWNQQYFKLEVPAGSGDKRENGEDSELLIELFDKNSMSNDTFLGQAVISGLALQQLLGLINTPKEQKNKDITIDDSSIATVSSAGKDITIERGGPMWFDLGKSTFRTMKENKLAQGSVQLQGTYISGQLIPGEGPLAANAMKKLVSVHICYCSLLTEVPSMIKAGADAKRMASKLGSFLGGKKADTAAPVAHKQLSNTSAFCVVRWNGEIVMTTMAVKNTLNPVFNDHVMIRVPPIWVLRQCRLEIQVFAEALGGSLTGNYGPFLGGVEITGKELLSLLSSKLVKGDYKLTTLPLIRTEHLPIDAQKLVGGTITMRGDVERIQRGAGRRGATTEEAITAVLLKGINSDEIVVDGDIVNQRRVVVHVIEAIELAQMDKFGQANAFVTLYWNGRIKGITEIVPNSINPKWQDEPFIIPLSHDILLTDNVLEVKVENKSRMGTITFMGCHRVASSQLERAANSQGEEFWFDLVPNKYLDEKGNQYATGAIKLGVSMYEGGVTDIPLTLPLVEEQYIPSRIELKVESLTNVPVRVGIPKMTLVTSKFSPYVQFIWNGVEVFCTSRLTGSYMDMDVNKVYSFKEEFIKLVLPPKRMLEDCILEIVMWDAGVKDKHGADTFCGIRHIKGIELLHLVAHTDNRDIFEKRLQDEEEGKEVIHSDVSATRFALQRSWDVDDDKQSFVKGTLAIRGEYIHERAAPAIEEMNEGEDGALEDISEEEEEEEEEEILTEEKLALQREEHFLALSEEEKSAILQDEVAKYWEEQKGRYVIEIEEGAAHYFTKHYDEHTGRFYYYDHVSNETTWDKPAGEIHLHMSEEQIDKIREIQEYRVARSKGLAKDTSKRGQVLEKMKKEREIHLRHYQAQKKVQEERRIKSIWQRAILDANRSRHDLTLTWQPLPVLDRSVLNYYHDFGVHLVALRLIGLGLTEMPDDFGAHLTHLKYLNLSNNALTTLPDSLCSMSFLEEMNLLKNRIQFLPDRIGLLASLVKLEIANNLLEKLPNTFGALNKLERVDLECNQLSVLPENLNNLLSCRILILNNNKLHRIPRCIAGMPSLTSLSATHNQITYIPQELTGTRTLKILRLSLNRITAVPDKIGDLKRLREVSLDHNNLFKLPLTMHTLHKLKTLRVEGNENLGDPPGDILNLGAKKVVEYFQRRYKDDVSWRQRSIITSVQNCLQQAWERDITDPSMFEPDTHINGGPDGWYALQLSYFWQELLPDLRSHWKHEGLRNAPRNISYINNFPYTEKEVVWAYSNFSDAYGMMLTRTKAMFRRCACVDENGRRKPCVPPQKGYMCYRYCTLLKMNFVMEGQRKERLWQAHKQAGIQEAVQKAEDEAYRYLHSTAGKLWLETEAYKRAEAALNAMGGEKQKQWQDTAIQKVKQAIIYHYDRKKERVQKIRDEKAHEIEFELERVKEDWSKAKEGYMKTTLEETMQDLLKQLQNMDENVHLERLARECERKCADAVDAIKGADDTDSSDSDASLPDSEDDSELAVLRRERYARRIQEKEENEKIARRRVPLAPIPKGPLETVWDEIEKRVVPVMNIVMPPNRAREKARVALYKRLKGNLIHVINVVDIRIRKIFAQFGGDFDEIQRESKVELYRQYLEMNVNEARDKAKREFDVIDQVRENMGGVGIEKVFKAWKRWALNKAQRIRRDARAEFRTSTLLFNAAMESVDIAQARVDMWKKNYDVYTDKPFWQHSMTSDVTLEKPGLHHYLPPSFSMPSPPKPLPEGVSLETSSDESEHAFRKEKVSKKKGRMKAKNKKSPKVSKKVDKKSGDGDGESDISSGSSSQEGKDDEEEEEVSSGTDRSSDYDDERFADDISALSESSSVRLLKEANQLPDIHSLSQRRPSDVKNPRDWPAAKERTGLGMQVPNTVSSNPYATTVDEMSVSVSSQSKQSISNYSYGPDSLRTPLPGRLGMPVFPDDEESKYEPTSLDIKVNEARHYIESLKGTDKERHREDFDINPSNMEEIKAYSDKQKDEEVNEANIIIRRKRGQLSMARHNTYMNQASRVPRSLEENVELRRQREQKVETYNKPDTELLLELAGGHELMTNLPGAQGVKLRTLLAHRALHVKDKIHKRALKKRLPGVKEKKESMFQRHIGPIWRENAYHSSDDESDDEEERMIHEQRKMDRQAEREAVGRKLLDERKAQDDADAMSSVFTINSAVPIEDRMGKPRSKINKKAA